MSFQSSAKYIGFSWVSDDQVAVQAARLTMSESRSVRAKIKSAVHWDTMQWVDKGSYIEWKQPTLYKNAYRWWWGYLSDVAVDLIR